MRLKLWAPVFFHSYYLLYTKIYDYLIILDNTSWMVKNGRLHQQYWYGAYCVLFWVEQYMHCKQNYLNKQYFFVTFVFYNNHALWWRFWNFDFALFLTKNRTSIMMTISVIIFILAMHCPSPWKLKDVEMYGYMPTFRGNKRTKLFKIK